MLEALSRVCTRSKGISILRFTLIGMRKRDGVRLQRMTALALIFVFAASAMRSNTSATSDTLEFEGERRWTVGGDSWIQELALGDVDGGGLPEIVSVGGSGDTGEIRVQGYTGSSFYDIVSPVYPAEFLRGVAIGNLDADPLNVVEIVSVGGRSTNGDISLWRMSGGVLGRVPGSLMSVPDAHFEGVGVMNLDTDAFPEVIVVGGSWVPSGDRLARLMVLSWDGAAWTVKASTAFDSGYDTAVYAIAAGELDGQAPADIVTVGHRRLNSGSLPDGQVAVWHYSGGTLTKIGEQFVIGGASHGVTIFDVAIGDPDNDLEPEVLAVGTQDWLTANASSQLHTFVLSPSGGLSQDSQESRPGEYWFSVAIGDVDMDGLTEAVVAGQQRRAAGGPWGALAVVRAVGAGFVHELDHRWLTWTWPWSTVVGDLDGDSVSEFLTGSQRSPVENAAEIRAWNWNVPTTPDDSWPQFHRDPVHSGMSDGVAPNTANVVWSKELQSGGTFSHDRYSPIVYDQKVYVVAGGRLRSYSLAGANAWSAPIIDTLQGPTARSVAAGGGRVYYGGSQFGTPPYGVLSAYESSNGNLIWTRGSETFSDQFVWAPPTVASDCVLVGTAGARSAAPAGRVFAWDKAGNLLWTFAPGTDVLAAVAVGGSQVYVRSGTDLYAIPLEDPDGDGVIANPGEIEWKFSMGVWSGPRQDVALTGSPTVEGGYVYVGSHDGFLWKVPAVDPTPGDRVMSSPDVTAGNGWKSAPLGEWVASTPTVFQASVFVGADLAFDTLRAVNAHLYRLDDADGQVTWAADYRGRVATSSPAVADGKVFVWAEDTSTRAFVFAYDLDGNPLWSKLVSDTVGANIGISVAISAGYLFTSNGVSASAAFLERAFVLAIKDP